MARKKSQPRRQSAKRVTRKSTKSRPSVKFSRKKARPRRQREKINFRGFVPEWVRENFKPAQVQQELIRLQRRHGVLTDKIVLAEIRKSTSPFHKAFPWDKDEAAERYWESQCRALIKCVEIVIVKAPGYDHAPRIPSFYNLPEVTDQTPSRRAWLDIGTIAQDPELTRKVRDECMLRLKRIRREFGHMPEFADLFLQIDQLALDFRKADRAEAPKKKKKRKTG